MAKVPRCQARVLKRDTYRVARGTKSGFRMHYNECQCARAATQGPFCAQHSKQIGGAWPYRFAAEFMDDQ